MLERGVWSMVLVGACALSCGSNDDRPKAPAAGGEGASSGTRHNRGGSAQAEGGEESTLGGARPEGGAGSDSPPIGHLGGAGLEVGDGGEVSTTPAQCPPEAEWSAPTSLAGIATPEANEQLLAMTHDELSLVFSRGTELYVADRDNASRAFGDPVGLTLPVGYTHTRGLALSPSGSSLVIVSSDGHFFAEVSRPARGDAFGGEADTSRFDVINDARSFSGAELSSPVLSASGKTFFYTERHGLTSDVWRAVLAEQFAASKKQDHVSLGAEDGKAKLTSSVSADERVLFVHDESLGHAVGLWRSTAQAEFSKPVEYPGLHNVFTSRGCDRLYGTAKVGASMDVVIETSN
jgi:hypothetical protein